jgi:hypothetical protein
MSSDREEQLIHMARRLNLELIKSRAKKWMPEDHQQYRIVDINNVIQAGKNFDMSLDEVEKFLQERESQLQSITESG